MLDSKKVKKCNKCFWNFDGVCASHGWDIDGSWDDGKDTYGMKIVETMKIFPGGCHEFKINFDDYVEMHSVNVDGSLKLRRK